MPCLFLQVNWLEGRWVSGMPYYLRTILALGILVILDSACQSTNHSAKSGSKGSRLFAVAVDSAAFFRHGPQAGRDPDSKLPKDTIVKLIRPSFGYSKIQVVTSGALGYISSEELKPASPTLLAAATTAAAPPPTRSAIEQFNLNSTDPRLVPPPEHLPDPDLPAEPQ